MYSIINISGLAVGMTGFLLLAIWLIDQLSFDKFHKNYERIAKVMQYQRLADGNVQTFDSSPVLLADEVEQNFPEVEEIARVTLDFQALVGTDSTSFFENGGYADAEFFKIFSFRVLSGLNADRIFTDDKSVVISESLALKLFGHHDAVGKSIYFNRTEVYIVSAVIEDVPESSSLKFDYILPFSAFLKLQPHTVQWSMSVAKTFVLLHNSNELESLSDKIKLIARGHNASSLSEFFLYPISRIHLYEKFVQGKNVGGRIDNLRLIGGIAILILAMACINFINLSTALSSSRAREVGIKKTVGAARNQLISRFLGETLLMALMALVLAMGLVHLILPVLNFLLDLKLVVNYSSPFILLTLILTAISTGVLAGMYPAWMLSSIQPIKAMKSLQGSSQRVWLRKTLITVQLVLSILLIVATIILFRQIQYIRGKDLGFSKENVLRFRARGDVLEKFDSFKTEALRNPAILQMTSTDSAPIGRRSATTGFSWPGKTEGSDVLLDISNVNYDFVETLGMDLLMGRSFSKDFPSDSMAVIINEAAVDEIGLTDPVGTKLKSGPYTFEIIGVLKNHHATSLQNDFSPFVFMLSPANSNYVMVRMASGKSEEAIRAIEKLYKQFEPGYPFEFTFLDEKYMELYENEVRLGVVGKWFSVLAIFISCLGLLGLSAYSADRRRKEIAIRKVMGASAFRIVMMLNLEYTKLVLLAMLLSLPVSFYVSSIILNKYVFKVEINEVAVLIFSGLILFTICLITVSYFSIKASHANPANTLKYE